MAAPAIGSWARLCRVRGGRRSHLVGCRIALLFADPEAWGLGLRAMQAC